MRDVARARRIGRNVFIGLALATVLEYLVAVSSLPGAIALIVAIALIKAALIVVYFMHIGQLRHGAH